MDKCKVGQKGKGHLKQKMYYRKNEKTYNSNNTNTFYGGSKR